MPQKINRAGQMQNYVPAGNGDASGEYGDNATGSNIHFKAFKKPEDETPINTQQPKTEETKEEQNTKIENQTETKTEEQENENQTTEEQKETMLDGLNKKDKQNLVGEIWDRRWMTDDSILTSLRNTQRWLPTLKFLENYSDEELMEAIKDIKYIKETREKNYFKKGSKWLISKEPKELLEKMGYQVFDKEGMEKEKIRESQELIEKSQTKQDKEVQNMLGGECVVCFGKGYSQDTLNGIVEQTKEIIDEFPLLKGFVKQMGDRNNLEKLINAQRNTRDITEEELKNKIDFLKSSYTIIGGNEQEIEEQYRKDAIKSLREPIKLDSIPNAYAYWNNDTKSLVFLHNMKSISAEKKVQEYVDNFKSSDKKNATLSHELGHAIDHGIDELYKSFNDLNHDDYYEIEKRYSQFMDDIDELKSKNYNPVFKDRFNELYTNYSGGKQYTSFWDRDDTAYNQTINQLQKEGIKQYNLSRYGATNRAEFIAESFSAYYGKMGNELANKVVEKIKDFYSFLQEKEKTKLKDKII